MESFLSRYKNLICLAAVLLAQLIGLAAQVKTETPQGHGNLLRTSAIALITPFEKMVIHAQSGVRNSWFGYFYLRGVRRENRELREQIEDLRLQQLRVQQDALQARRLQALLGFKEQFVSQTIAAQAIGTSGSEQSKLLDIDKGANDGIKQDMAVIAPGGIVGKVLTVYPTSARVLLINDQLSGVGAILQNSRLQGIVSGSPNGALILKYIMKDEKVSPGDLVITSGGDHVFPKGMPIGTVAEVSPGRDLFLEIRIRPAVSLNSVEEVLVVTRIVERSPTLEETGGPVRAADILAQRLPGLPSPTPTPSPGAGGAPAAQGTAPSPATQARPAGQVPPPSAKPSVTPSPASRGAGTAPAARPAGTVGAPGASNGTTRPAPVPTAAAPARPKATPAQGAMPQ